MQCFVGIQINEAFPHSSLTKKILGREKIKTKFAPHKFIKQYLKPFSAIIHNLVTSIVWKQSLLSSSNNLLRDEKEIRDSKMMLDKASEASDSPFKIVVHVNVYYIVIPILSIKGLIASSKRLSVLLSNKNRDVQAWSNQRHVLSFD